jgi:co-chaperonin GroES (HSP10)
MKPSSDRLLVKELKPTETKGGIIIPATSGDAKAKNTLIRCEVVAVGPGAIHAEDGHEVRRLSCSEIAGVPLEVGAVVLCSRYLGVYRWQDATGAWQEYQVVGASEILGVEA